MRRVLKHLFVLLLIAANTITWAQVIRKDLKQANDDARDKRAVDFGLLVRNLLLKSATASNAKATIAGNVRNLKTTTSAPRRRTTTTTTATSVAPFYFNKGLFKFPFDFSGHINNKFNNNPGYINFDYNDYGGQQPLRPGRRRRPTTTSTTTTSTTTTAPLPTRRRPIPRRPYGFLGKQNLPPFDYYDDYDYNYDDAPAAAPAPAPSPNPPTARPQRRPTANRARAQGRVPQLRNRFVYQYRQPDDTSTNNDAVQPTDATNSQTNNSNNDETSTTTNNLTNTNYDDDNADAANDEGEAVPDDNNSNTEQDYNDSSDNANPNVNLSPNNENANGNVNSAPAPPPLANQNFNFNGNLPPLQSHFGSGENLNAPSGFNNFGYSGGFQYSPYSNFNPQYQPSSPAGYSVRYY